MLQPIQALTTGRNRYELALFLFGILMQLCLKKDLKKGLFVSINVLSPSPY